MIPTDVATTRGRLASLFPPGFHLHLAVAGGGVALICAIGGLCVALAGGDPGVVAARLVRETLLSPYGLGQTLFKATPLIFTGLAVALPLRAGLFNIGAEGQLYIGTFVAAWIALLLPALPGSVIMLVATAGALLGGGLWGDWPAT